MRQITNIKKRLLNLHYLNRGIVFFSDLILSTGGGIISLITISSLTKQEYTGFIFPIIGFAIFFSALLLFLTGSYKASIRFSTIQDFSKIFYAMAVKAILMACCISFMRIFVQSYLVAVYAIMDLIITSFLMIFARVLVVRVYYAIVNADNSQKKNLKNTLIYGALGNAPLLAGQINEDVQSPYQVIGFLSSGNTEHIKIAGQYVYNWGEDINTLELVVNKHNVTHILFTSMADFNLERDRLVDFCIENNIQMLMGGGVYELDKNKNAPRYIKPVDIEDLLYREEIKMDSESVAEQISGKIVLITGAAGSIGSEIAKQLAHFNFKSLILLDCAETPLHNLALELTRDFPDKNIFFELKDVRSEQSLSWLFAHYKPNYVFHAAAYKHVPVIESHPCEGILTNIWGTVNTANHAVRYGVEKFIMISTDKAINPTNVMGASKRIAELWVQGLNLSTNKTSFIITRFGNVLGSNGSVIPLFKEQIAKGGPVTVTHPEMIRYFMTIPEACRLVLQAASMGSGGEIFVFDMGEQVKIDNLARRMILLSGLVPDEDIKIVYTGLRPGEKLYEELLTESESTQMTEHHKIRIAKADNIETVSLRSNIYTLINEARNRRSYQAVQMMKLIVPEFRSNNSEFETLDLKDLDKQENEAVQNEDYKITQKGFYRSRTNGIYYT